MKKEKKYFLFPKRWENILLIVVSLGLVGGAFLLFFLANIKIPDFNSFEDRKIINSTRIYDRTGKIPLFNLQQNMRRTEIPFDQMGTSIKNATIAIEDPEFYQHGGIRIKSIIRAALTNLTQGSLLGGQGGSTITQQVIKGTLLTPEKTLGRKIKEWVLAIKIEQVMSKDKILETYLNEAPYGSNVYGVKEGANYFFGKDPKDLTLSESAYMAAIVNRPTYYSPYGENRQALENRKALVLDRMLELGFIGEEEYETALKEENIFIPRQPYGIKAPHFVFYVKQLLVDKYGEDMVENGGLKVTTTLDYDLQLKGESAALERALYNEKNFNGENIGLLAMNPKTGEILTMVGSRNYFDENIDGNYNITLAERQPGSAFKPFVYATAFKEGYTPETVLFDLKTEFQTTCDAYGKALPGQNQDECYMPTNYDGKYTGPISLRDALAQSRNIPAVKLIYLAGIKDSIKTAQDMGIRSMENADRYGLTLVLGGGEVSLFDMTSAYGVFANSGVKNNPQAILKVEDVTGKVLYEFAPEKAQGRQILDRNVALQINDILADNIAREPEYGLDSPLTFKDRAVAVKTGTTNNFRDAWILGYTPSIAVGAWTGNNDNTPMEKKISGFIIGPFWREFMDYAFTKYPQKENFEKPSSKTDYNTPPALRGFWQGGENFLVDSFSGKLATEYTAREAIQEKVITDVHSILFWIDKNEPLKKRATPPSSDPQFSRWEIPIKNWWERNINNYNSIYLKPSEYDDIHTSSSAPVVEILSPVEASVYNTGDKIDFSVQGSGLYPIIRVDIYINGIFVKSLNRTPFSGSIFPTEVNFQPENELKAVVFDSILNKTESSIKFFVVSAIQPL